MRRILPLLLCLLLLFGCSETKRNICRNSSFSAELPEHFETVPNSPILCFAPYGDPLHSSSITVAVTELNWYFDDFSNDDYSEALSELCGYESITVKSAEVCRVDGHNARRIVCSVLIDQGEHDLVLYAISADRTYFFTLLNRQGDDYIDAFETMMKTIRFTEAK